MEIRGFRGWRYVATPGGDISQFIAPPYDILNATDKQKLLARCDRNIVKVDLPHVPPKEVGPDSEYIQAADTLKKWMAAGVLKQDAKPAIYAYRQTFPWGGKTYTRCAILCGVRATELGKDVIPHEHTFAGPKADRLRLMELTGVQISPIFGFFTDSAGVVKKTFAAAGPSPAVTGMVGDVKEELWVIDSPTQIAMVASALKNTPVYIADGHHRYTTQMNYAKSLREAGKIDADNETNFVQFALVPQDDPGLLILPTQRIIRGLNADFTLEKLIAAAPQFKWEKRKATPKQLADAETFLKPYGYGAMAFMSAGGAQVYVATLADKQAMVQAAGDQTQAWRDLDVAILHKLIVDKALSAWKSDKTLIDYTPDAKLVLDALKNGGAQLGVCLQGTPLSAVQAIANAGACMPHKSTYFYPKLTTGIVLKPLS